MRQLWRKLASLSQDEGFMQFQNALSLEFYESLGRGYNLNDNEVSLVKRLVDVANGKSYAAVKFSASMLHGSRSYVEFNHRDKPVTKELGDMAIISLVTHGQVRLLQKVCIIQNKKTSGNSWSIDQEQLFLLKNFPPFSGNKGIFKGCHDLSFKNTSGCLGMFGLMKDPGEMILVSAPLLSGVMGNKKSINLDDLSFPAGLQNHYTSSGCSGFPYWPFAFRFGSKEWMILWEELMHFGYPNNMMGGTNGNGYLTNCSYCLDMFDFSRAWTQLNLGEVTCFNNSSISKYADAFAGFLLRSAGLHEIPSGPGDNVFGDREFDGSLAIFVMHLDLTREE
ncbi:MAG: hypothetical protein GY928_17235 [Colwellia sp.]|nr:hypothetical protein [Colwellia sp.]